MQYFIYEPKGACLPDETCLGFDAFFLLQSTLLRLSSSILIKCVIDDDFEGIKSILNSGYPDVMQTPSLNEEIPLEKAIEMKKFAAASIMLRFALEWGHYYMISRDGDMGCKFMEIVVNSQNEEIQRIVCDMRTCLDINRNVLKVHMKIKEDARIIFDACYSKLSSLQKQRIDRSISGSEMDLNGFGSLMEIRQAVLREMLYTLILSKVDNDRLLFCFAKKHGLEAFRRSGKENPLYMLIEHRIVNYGNFAISSLHSFIKGCLCNVNAADIISNLSNNDCTELLARAESTGEESLIQVFGVVINLIKLYCAVHENSYCSILESVVSLNTYKLHFKNTYTYYAHEFKKFLKLNLSSQDELELFFNDDTSEMFSLIVGRCRSRELMSLVRSVVVPSETSAVSSAISLVFPDLEQIYDGDGVPMSFIGR